MKNERFRDAQIMAVLKQAEGGSPLSALGRHGSLRPQWFTCLKLKLRF
jgi:hypothetical protein